jgi:hypothetical protein
VIIFLIFDLNLDNIQIEISQKVFNRAQKTGVEKKTLGQDLSIGSSLDKIGLTNAEK